MLIDVLIDKINALNNPTVVGLDPRLSYIPDFIKEECVLKSGDNPEGVAEAFFLYNKMIIDEIKDIVPAVKPQIAMYEQYGPAGIDAFIKTVNYAKEQGLIVIGDIKRGDIQSTAEAYSDGHIGEVPTERNKFTIYNEDFITLNPYLGGDSISPYLDNCKKYDKGLFILVKTSNPKSSDIQNLVSGDKKVYEHVGLLVKSWGEDFVGRYGFSQIGAVVGATHKEEAEVLRKLLPNVFFLVPGYGAQGATAEDLAVCFNKDGIGSIVNSSRGIILAYKSEKYKGRYKETDFAKASRDACLDMKTDLLNYIKG